MTNNNNELHPLLRLGLLGGLAFGAIQIGKKVFEGRSNPEIDKRDKIKKVAELYEAQVKFKRDGGVLFVFRDTVSPFTIESVSKLIGLAYSSPVDTTGKKALYRGIKRNPESLKKASSSNIKKIKKAINTNHFVDERVSDLEGQGFLVKTLPMGSGGTGQVKEMADGTVRIQIGYGKGKYNYAPAVILNGPYKGKGSI